MSNLPAFIQGVLQKRQSQKPRLDSAQRGLSELVNQLSQLAELASEATGVSQAKSELQQMVAVLTGNLGNLKTRITDLQARIANLLVRFGKDTINIGVAGKARQGKSTLLQKISGHDNTVIPTSDGLPCTGAKSKILHQEQEPHAVIEFYSETEFLKGIVHAYYDDLQLPSRPTTLADFRRALPAFDSELPEKHAVYKKLQELHTGLAAFGKYLSHRPGRIPLADVRDFVSQEGGRKLYLAVKCANIFVRFPNQDVTGLGIVDLPGLGEIAKGHGQKLVRSLQREVDAVVLIKLPGSEGALWDKGDYEVFNRIKQAVPEIDLADWLFPVLNETGPNHKQVQLLKQHPPDVGTSLTILSANCSSHEDVDRQIFTVVLQHLQNNLERIDQQYLANLYSQLSLLANDVEAAIEPAREFFRTDRMGVEDELKFNELFDEFLEELRGNLELLVSEYRKRLPSKASVGMLKKLNPMRSSKAVVTDVFVGDFQDAVDEACEAADLAPPVLTAQELNRRFFDRGGWNAVLQEQLHHMRSHLTHQLAESLDRRLKSMADEAQKEMLNRLLAPPLAQVLPADAQGSKNPDSRIQAFRKLLNPNSQPTLVAALDYLLSFTFSYQSHFHYRVRQVMELLDPMAPAGQIGLPVQGDVQSDEIAKLLADRYHTVVANVRKVLHSDLQYDSLKAIFAMIEETRDRLVRARSVGREWRILLYLYRGDIWPDKFNQFAIDSARRLGWQMALDAISQSASFLRSALKA